MAKNTSTTTFAGEKKIPRLAILKNFMLRNGLTHAEVAKALDKTQQALFRNFRIDDIYISELETAFRYFGYDLRVEIRRYTVEARAKDNIITMEPHIRRYYDDGCLPFLCLAMARYDITILQMAKDLEMSDTAMRHMFNVNNISLSRLLQICSIYGLSLFMDVYPAGTAETQVVEGRGPRMVTSYTWKKTTTDVPFDNLGRED
jgi:hypothetical protein